MPTATHTPFAHEIWLGRERELARLEAGLDELIAGHGSVFLVTGEPGIGKTRLADRFGRRAAARGIGVHWGRAWEAGGAPSFWPFIQALRSMCRGLAAEALAERVGRNGPELVELLPELRERLPGLPPAPASTTRERFQLFEAVAAFVHAAATPQMLVLDDLHAADPSSLLLLHFLVRDLRAGPLLVVGTYREAEARMAPEVGRTLALVAREAIALPLRRLDPREVGVFVAQATGTVPATERVEALHRQTEGNPLFLRELLQLQGGTAGRSEGIREVVRARLALLTPPARQALEVAAVLGRDFALDALAAVAGASEPDVERWIGPAADAGIVEPLELPGRWRFTHVLLREGLYEALSAGRRAELHRAAGAELRRPRHDATAAELAHHLLAAIPAVPLAEAADAALGAAAHAMDLLAFEDAGALLERIARLLEVTPAEERRLFEVLLALGLARIRAGEVNAGKQTCRRAMELARRLGDGAGLARAVLVSGYEFVPGLRDAAGVALLEDALAALPPGDGALRARCMAQLASERQPEPDTAGPVELARAAVAMARRAGDAETLRFTLAAATMTMVVFGDPEERLALDREVLALAIAAGEKRMALRAHLFLSNDHWELGDAAGADAHLHAHEALVAETGQKAYRWVPLCMRATSALWRGRIAEAARLYREADELARDDEARGASMAASYVGVSRAAEGADDLPAMAAHVRSRLGARPLELGGCVAEMIIAQLHGRSGDRGLVAAQLAAVTSHPLFPAVREASWLALLAEPCHVVGDTALAERLYPFLLPRARRFFTLGPLGPCCEPPYTRQLGLLAHTLGRLDDAVAHLDDALARAEGSGMRSHLARMRVELAAALRARGAPGDAERAAALLVQARALAEELGQTGLLSRLEPTPRAAEAGPEPAAPALALRREGEYWTLAWGDRSLRLRDSRGLQVLALLVASQGQELHVLQLVGPGDDVGDGGDAGEVLDAAAVQSYRTRLRDLREELEEAEGFGDTGRAERARAETEALTQELARAVGLGGRSRRTGGAAERARTAVQKRLRNVIERIEAELPELARHLDQTLRTGAFCGYLPEGRPRGRRP